MRPFAFLTLILVLGGVHPADALSATVEYVISAAKDHDAVVFVSKAPLEDFSGRTNSVSGRLRVDPDDLAAGLELSIEVQLADLDTGIGLRNRHMRENHLHTKEFPVAVFAGHAFAPESPASLPIGETTAIEVEGRFDLHGVELPRTLEVRVTRTASGSLEIESKFAVSLQAHEIPRPKFLVMKIADEQQLTVRVNADEKNEDQP